MKRITLLFLVLALSAATIGQTITTVSQIKDNFDEDEGVVSRGEVTGLSLRLDEEYNFSDNTGSIRIDWEQDWDDPNFNQTMTVGAIMDYDNNVMEIDIKYFHYGSNSIIDELGIETADNLYMNPEDDLPFVLAGVITGPGSEGGKYMFEDNTGELELSFGNMDQPPYNSNLLVFGVIDFFFEAYYNIYYYEAGGVGLLENNLASVRVHPNPASEYVQIDFADKFTSVQVIDITGKVVLEEENSSAEKFFVGNLETGLYFVTLFNEEQLVGSQKMMIK